jgi:5-methylcytosine-specific restriction protein B
VTTVQFHPSYAYEDFVQGYRPALEGFALRAGVFFRFCERARSDPGRAHVFVIDEINRGNLAKVFGELLMLLEPDKRGADWAVPLAYAAADAPAFFIPKNVYLLGLMNTADRSLAVVDYALRRRFAFVSLQPAYGSERFHEHLQEKGIDEPLRQKIVERMNALNERIANDKTNLGPGFCIGHSFFCDPPEDSPRHGEWYTQVVESEIAPLLREYYFDDTDRAQALINGLL